MSLPASRIDPMLRILAFLTAWSTAFAVSGDAPQDETARQAAASCPLGSADNGLVGTYWTDGRITFDRRPVKEWEFMATGTGVTGLVVSFPNEMLLQINQASAIDEDGKVRALARLHVRLDGDPFANAKTFRMTTFLRRSTICAVAETDDGPVRVEIRAHVPLDALRIDVFDERKTPGAMSIALEEDSPCKKEPSAGNRMLFFHENPQEGPAINAENRHWLAGRTFGLCVETSPGDVVRCDERQMTAAPSRHHVLNIVGASERDGKQAFLDATSRRSQQLAAMPAEVFLETHEAWWRAFWDRSSFVPDDPTGRMIRYRAAFDLFRYYTACSTSDRRETPARFQIELYRYHLRQHGWLTMGLCAVEMYQSVFGTMRTGDWETLRSEFRFLKENLPYYKDQAQRAQGVEGAFIPMGHKPWSLRPGKPIRKEDRKPPTIADGPYNGNNPAGPLFMLSLMCDYVDVSGDREFAEDTLWPLATEILTYFRLRYARPDGRICFDPCNAGETWQFVKNPAEMVCAFRALLPRLIAVGQRLQWPNDAVDAWRTLLAAAPPIPRGTMKYDPEAHDVKPEILPGDMLVPAEDMSNCKAYVLPWGGPKPWYNINGQHTELFAIWPTKLTLRDAADYESSRKSYESRFWKHVYHGWTLDVVNAACLGLWDDVSQWFDKHFDATYVLPCGLACETAPRNPACAAMPEYPSLQGMGTGVIPVLEMLLQDYPDELIVLPCWPENAPVQFSLYSPFAGKVRVEYEPGKRLLVATDRETRVRLSRSWKSPVPVKCEVGP